MNEAICQDRFVQFLDISVERVEWMVGKCSTKEKFVNINFCVSDRFIFELQQSSSGSIRYVGSEQIFRKTYTVIQPLEGVLSSSNFGIEVADMLVRVVHCGVIFKIYANCISDFIFREASLLEPEYQMLKITVRLEDISMILFDEMILVTNYTTIKLEDVECNSPVGKALICPVCLEKLMDSKKDEMAIKGMPCGHVFHGNCIEMWLKMKPTCPMCRFHMPPPKLRFTITRDQLSWKCETDFQNLMHVTPTRG